MSSAKHEAIIVQIITGLTQDGTNRLEPGLLSRRAMPRAISDVSRPRGPYSQQMQDAIAQPLAWDTDLEIVAVTVGWAWVTVVAVSAGVTGRDCS